MYSPRMNDAVSTVTTIEPVHRVCGRLRVPGDKSISHRYAILAALADGTSTLHGYAPGADCLTTLECLRELGVAVQVTRSAQGPLDATVTVDGLGLGGLHPAAGELDAGNSGTTMRLLAGVLAAHPFETTITGDASLRHRPMQRIVGPLETMGARIETAAGRPPITIPRRCAARDRICAGDSECAGQECGPPGRSSRRRKHVCKGADGDQGPHRTRTPGIRHRGPAG